ncbi:MAG: GNAT family N-acetyltransferase [Neisseriaceae bacterium]|nr:MAG: GNAT family N-acetyltransferase [Neisseriaceae bacterium]
MSLITFIRKATSYDCEEIYNVHLFAVQYACKNCYDDKILEAWSQLLYPESYLASLKNKELWLIEYKNQIQGFFQLDLKNAELDALYVHPFVHNNGLGTALIQKAEKIAYDSNLTFIKLYASLNSVYFYELSGYKKLQSCQLMLNNKTGIDCVFMKKDLMEEYGL